MLSESRGAWALVTELWRPLFLFSMATNAAACQAGSAAAPTPAEAWSLPAGDAGSDSDVFVPETLPTAVASAASPAPPVDHAVLCVRREQGLPIDEAGGLAPVPLPRGLYWIQIDEGPRIEMRPDMGTRVLDVDLGQRHRVALFRKDRRVAVARLNPTKRDVCVGLSNYARSVSIYDWGAKRCGCADNK